MLRDRRIVPAAAFTPLPLNETLFASSAAPDPALFKMNPLVVFFASTEFETVAPLPVVLTLIPLVLLLIELRSTVSSAVPVEVEFRKTPVPALLMWQLSRFTLIWFDVFVVSTPVAL